MERLCLLPECNAGKTQRLFRSTSWPARGPEAGEEVVTVSECTVCTLRGCMYLETDAWTFRAVELPGRYLYSDWGGESSGMFKADV